MTVPPWWWGSGTASTLLESLCELTLYCRRFLGGMVRCVIGRTPASFHIPVRNCCTGTASALKEGELRWNQAAGQSERASRRPELRASSRMSVRLIPGDQAPAFELADQDGRLVGLDNFKGRRVVVYIYLPQGRHSGRR